MKVLGRRSRRAASPPKVIEGDYRAQRGSVLSRVKQFFIESWTGTLLRAYSEAVCHLKAEKTPHLSEEEGQLFSSWMCRQQLSGQPLGCTILQEFLVPVLLNQGQMCGMVNIGFCQGTTSRRDHPRRAAWKRRAVGRAMRVAAARDNH